MKITIKSTNLEISDSIHAYVSAKINSLDRFVQNVNPVECWMEVEKTTDHHRKGDIFRAEAQIKLPGASGLRAEASEWDLHQAIDKVKDELQRQLKRYKRKMVTKRRKGTASKGGTS